jgi:hypothetical protein
MSNVAPVTAVLVIRSTASAGIDDALYRQCGAKLLASRVEPVTENRRREGRVDESRRNDIDTDRGKLEGEAPGQGSNGGGDCGYERARGRTTPSRAADQEQAAGRSHRILGQPGDLDGKHDALESTANVVDIELREGHIVRPAPDNRTWSTRPGRDIDGSVPALLVGDGSLTRVDATYDHARLPTGWPSPSSDSISRQVCSFRA